MAQAYKNAKKILTTSSQDIYICPSSTTAVVIGCQITNRSSSNVAADFWWVDSSDSNAATYLADGTEIFGESAYEPIGGRLVLESGDKLSASAGSDNDLEVTVSILELS